MTESLTVRDNRTGQEYEVPIADGAIKAADLGQIKAGDDTPGLAVYDPGFVNTASCRSSVRYSLRAIRRPRRLLISTHAARELS